MAGIDVSAPGVHVHYDLTGLIAHWISEWWYGNGLEELAHEAEIEKDVILSTYSIVLVGLIAVYVIMTGGCMACFGLSYIYVWINSLPRPTLIFGVLCMIASSVLGTVILGMIYLKYF